MASLYLFYRGFVLRSSPIVLSLLPPVLRYALAMAGAAWPTPRGRARTPSIRSSTHRQQNHMIFQCSKFEPSSHPISNHPFNRPSPVDDALPWRRSRSSRLPHDSAEAVGRASSAVPRVQQLAGLHRHDRNYHRQRRAQQDGRGWWLLHAWVAAASLPLHAAALGSLSGGSDERLDDRGRAQVVIAGDQVGRRRKRTVMAAGAVWQAECWAAAA